MYLLDQSALTGMSDQSLNCSSFDWHLLLLLMGESNEPHYEKT